MAQEEVHDAGLALGLSLGGGGGGDSSRRRRREASSSQQCPLEPSLTLSMPDDAATLSGGGVSSMSAVKRERAEEEEEEEAAEMVSSTALQAAFGGAGAGAEEDDDGSTRKKLRLTKEQSALLEDRFKEHSTLNPKQKVALAKQLNLRPRQVEVWFQNRRARTKLKQTEVDCEFLKRCCENLTEENRRLQRELHELRALKFAPPPPPPPLSAAAAPPPFYMQLPAATLTICPSCERLGGSTAANATNNTSKAVDSDVRPKGGTHHFFNPFTHSAAC
ncbi:homeobox-leucine zipper protein HOX19 [Brachypodium distachyon]|uniref:Homeobox domain-containing protein n=1 Tax=Brachypodium distachyon TaxID=15368 RepID=I1H7T3_BRADI|nr:homeobox-leucine zipper protein HOX19 [Brachypodium distachyon]KQK22747.1 hypothetical protein BRADI_1g69150v3 [Brachypodium distachyon]|eukprot:XP_003558432.1 homeobox-leucine zipper protein HOX19 [Brachypodium distachyon]